MQVDVRTAEAAVLQGGIRDYKFKNSSTKPAGHTEGRKGAIFAWRDKERMQKGYGVVITSQEALFDAEGEYTHWTPNVFRFGTYTDIGKHKTKGHSEDNLRQINTFMVDIDARMRGRPTNCSTEYEDLFQIRHNHSEPITSSDILTASIDLGYMPTMILKTDRGYQVYFVLSSPAYVTSHSSFKVVKVAKKISETIREYFAADFPVDLTCNHFGIARIPRLDNIEFYDANYRYSFADWLQWSIKREDAVSPAKPELTLITGSNGKRQIDEPWFELLLHKSKIRGEKGLYGRNTALFTLALAYYSSGVSKETCEANLEQFNEYLEAPLIPSEYKKTIASAYSGKYQAANHDYILPLCQEWVSSDLTAKDLFVRQRWVKFKRPRVARVRSHIKEWRIDLVTYLKSKSNADHPYIATTSKQIIADIGIPARSLAKLLKQMHSSGEIVAHTKRGRDGGITMALSKVLLVAAMQAKQLAKIAYQSFLDGLVSRMGKAARQVIKRLKTALKAPVETVEIELFERDTG